jgi:glutathione S-transferase
MSLVIDTADDLEALLPPELKQALRQRLDARFQILANALEGKDYLAGETFSVADGYAYYTLRNLRRLDAAALEQSAPLKAFFERVEARPAVRAALQAEAL